MTVAEFLSMQETKDYHVHHSIILVGADDKGCVYKWLEKANSHAIRKEVFIELDESESELALEDKTVINSIEIQPAKM